MFGIIFGHSCAITITSNRPIWSSYLYIHDIPTWDTGVCGLEVSHQILAAGLHLEQIRVGDLDDAGLSPGAASVHHPEDVGRAAHIVRGEAVAPGHPAVVGRGHQDHLAVAARGVKHIPLAVLLHFCKHTHTTPSWLNLSYVWNSHYKEKWSWVLLFNRFRLYHNFDLFHLPWARPWREASLAHGMWL